MPVWAWTLGALSVVTSALVSVALLAYKGLGGLGRLLPTVGAIVSVGGAVGFVIALVSDPVEGMSPSITVLGLGLTVILSMLMVSVAVILGAFFEGKREPPSCTCECAGCSYHPSQIAST